MTAQDALDRKAPAPTPRWMRVVGAVRALAFVINVARDLFLPESRAVEVWFGLEVRGPLGAPHCANSLGDLRARRVGVLVLAAPGSFRGQRPTFSTPRSAT